MQAPAPTTHIRPCRCAVAGATRSKAAMGYSQNRSVGTTPRGKKIPVWLYQPIRPRIPFSHPGGVTRPSATVAAVKSEKKRMQGVNTREVQAVQSR